MRETIQKERAKPTKHARRVQTVRSWHFSRLTSLRGKFLYVDVSLAASHLGWFLLEGERLPGSNDL
jgi:hypothetical protein